MAQVEFDAAANWYEGQRAEFTIAVRRVLDELRRWPKAHPVVHPGIREALVPRFPYAIYYQVDPNRVSIVAIFPTARDPGDWQGRL